jgi:bacterioferritin-associated ferredoxin
MYICLCRGVNDRAIRAAIAAGARTRDEVILRTSAGSRCGGCWPALEELLADAADEHGIEHNRVA